MKKGDTILTIGTAFLLAKMLAHYLSIAIAFSG
jgi:hypothetical protein